MRTTSVEGRAANAKAGAVVVLDDGAVVYVPALERWPDGLDGKRVVVTGERGTRKLVPDPVVGPNGERSAGAEGAQDVLEKATWKPAPAPTAPR